MKRTKKKPIKRRTKKKTLKEEVKNVEDLCDFFSSFRFSKLNKTEEES